MAPGHPEHILNYGILLGDLAFGVSLSGQFSNPLITCEVRVDTGQIKWIVQESLAGLTGRSSKVTSSRSVV